MNFKNRYDSIIQEIEDAVKKNVDQNLIYDMAAQKAGVNLRMLGDAFLYITDMTLSQYIRQRRLVKALQYKHSSGCSLEDAAIESGFPDAATMSKSFKKVFDVSPSQMTKSNLDKIVPLYLDQLLQEAEDSTKMEIQARPLQPVPETVFGVSVEQFEDIKNVLELNAIYGLSDKLAEFAYKLCKNQQVPMSKAFEFVEDLDMQFENGTYLGALSNISLEEIAYLCFHHNLSVSESIEEVDRLHGQGVVDVTDLPSDFYCIYFGDVNKDYDFLAEDILEFVATLKAEGIDVSEFDDIVRCNAILHDGDIIETIRCWDEDNDAIMDQFYDDLDHEYEEHPPIWEIGENEYHEHLTGKLLLYDHEEKEYSMNSEHKSIDEYWDLEDDSDDN